MYHLRRSSRSGIPANGEVIDTVPSLDLDQAREAIDVAYDPQEKLPAMGVAKRSRALL
jgi:acyl-CoA reductase-like NAD-dependent aldehyde dehydrogenase